jgi:hypothetical protein
VSTELEIRRSELPTAADMNAAALYAERLAQSMLLPKQYFKQPANVLYAVEYGRMIGLTPMAAITGVHVIEGKPTASAALITALVRRAGHKLRVRGDARSAKCQIIRSDDPDFVFEATYTIEDARGAKLLNKDVWQKYPASMLKARAITQCARDACEEVLFGLHYTPEELGAEVDEEGEPLASPEPQYTPQAAADAVTRKEEEYRVVQRRGGKVVDEFTLPMQPQASEPDVAETVPPTVDEIVAAIEAATTAEQVRELYKDIVVGQKLGGLIVPGHVYGAEVSVLQAITTRGQQLAEAEAPKAEPELAAKARVVKLNMLIKKKFGITDRNDKLAKVITYTARSINSTYELYAYECEHVISQIAGLPDFVPVESEEQREQSARAEAEALAKTDEPDPTRIEADLRDEIESAGSFEEIASAWTRVQAAESAGGIDAAAVARLGAAASRREDQLKADQGWSHRTALGRAMDAAA